MKVIKRDGQKVDFDASKIENAILKAMKCGSGIVDTKCAHDIAVEIEKWHEFDGNNISIYRIEGQVFEKLIEKGQILTAKAYEGYRKVREFQRETNTIDNEIYGIVNQTNKEAMEENSNKDATVLATQRDLIAGEFSRDYCRRLLLPPKIVQAHDDGIIHFHDMDYYIQKMHNCDLVNLKDMFAKGTVINDKLIETPKSLQTACTVATQIVQQVANGQYGGQTISLAHLSPYVRLSYEKHQRNVRREGQLVGIDYTQEQIDKIANARLKDEIKAGIQTIQYQINTFSTTNGQAPFLSVFMYLREEPEYIKETAMYCSLEAEQEIKRRLCNYGVHGIHFLDNGNYHYMTKIFAEKINMPFSLVLFDHHNDMQQPLIHQLTGCGSWAAEMLQENIYLKQLILIGPNQETIREIDDDFKEKLVCISINEIEEGLAKEEIKKIDITLPAYISIDKDVLNHYHARTNWDQGNMSVYTLKKLLEEVFKHQEVIGIDICGECNLQEPLQQLIEDEKINHITNDILYHFLSRYIS